jgi:hypothetical protein
MKRFGCFMRIGSDLNIVQKCETVMRESGLSIMQKNLLSFLEK